MTLDFTHIATLEVGNRIGECVLWDDARDEVVWTDIPSKRLWRWQIDQPNARSAALPEELASFALTEEPGVYVGAFRRGFAQFDESGRLLHRFANTVAEDEPAAMNDGRVDRKGRFLATTKMLDLDDPNPNGRLWLLAADGSARPFLGKMKVPNGLAFSPDGRWMYLSDSETATIWRFLLDFGDPLSGAPFARTPPGVKPDGACIDTKGRLWVAYWGGGAVVCYNPDGSEAGRLQLPVSRPTCVALGGAELDLLLVTSASDDLDEAEPLAGALFVFRTNAIGVAEARCSKIAVTADLSL